MRLVSWNVNSLPARLERLQEMLVKHEPDVVCLQETECAGDAFPDAALAAAGYGAVHFSAGRRAGVAILARSDHALTDVVRGLQGEPEPGEARWIEATVGGVRVASVHVVDGRAVDSPYFTQKLLFLDAIRARAHLWVDEGARGVIAGDFNVAPADGDVHDPQAFAGSTHVTEAERGRLRALLELGYVDAHRAVHGEGAVQYTWWDPRRGHFHRGMGLRIDLAFVRDGIGVRACGTDCELREGSEPSDHAPLIVELES